MQSIKHTYSLLTIALLLLVQSAFSQAYKSGDQVEALINNTWKPVKVLRLVAGKTDLYEVQAVTPTGATSSVIATYQVKEQNIRSINKAAATGTIAIPVTAAVETGSLKLGKYNMYAGVQNVYMGKFELQPAGNYIVALASDEDSYATGTYTYDAATNTITWKTGFFWQKKYEGKINAAGRIVFSRNTYAEFQQ